MLGVMDAIDKKPDVMRELFVYSLRPLDATTFENLFSIQWSEPGSNRNQAEKRTLTHFRDLLQDLEGRFWSVYHKEKHTDYLYTLQEQPGI